MRSEGGDRKDGGGSPGIEPTPVEFKRGRDGRMERWLLCIINQKQ